MGLDTSHDCWHGSYGGFNDYREALADAAGYDLEKLWGLDWPDGSEAGKWPVLPHDPLVVLLQHSDCDGVIPWDVCGELAERLAGLSVSDQWVPFVARFVDGLREAHALSEDVDFH